MRRNSPVREWTWFALICCPQFFDDVGWTITVKILTALLPPRWRRYLDSWNDLVSLNSTLFPSRDAWSDVVLNTTSSINNINSTIRFKWFVVTGSKSQERISYSTFVQTTATVTLHRYSIIIPSSNEQLGLRLNWKHWERYWKHLRKIRRRIPYAEDTAHLLSLRSLHPGAHTGGGGRLAHLQPNNTLKTCVLCGIDTVESITHIFIECTISQSLWTAAARTGTTHPTLRLLLCPPIIKGSTNLIPFTVLYIHKIWKLVRSRRYSTITPLSIIDNLTIDKMAQELNQDWNFSGLNKGF